MSEIIPAPLRIEIPNAKPAVYPREVEVGWTFIRTARVNRLDMDRNPITGEEWITVGATQGLAAKRSGDVITVDGVERRVAFVGRRYRDDHRTELVDVHLVRI